MGLRQVHAHHLLAITLAALRYAGADAPTFPGPVGKRGAELRYRVGDLSTAHATGPPPRPAPPTWADRTGRAHRATAMPPVTGGIGNEEDLSKVEGQAQAGKP
ncbi:hypothetical protein ACWEWI_09875 [Streptomyces sp. NPDC003753]